jgi:ABC-type proline/glycine betaine transport system permease subunit
VIWLDLSHNKRLNTAIGLSETKEAAMWEFLMDPFERVVIPLDQWVETALNWAVINLRGVFQIIRWPIDHVLGGIEGLLLAIPPFVIIAIFGLISW